MLLSLKVGKEVKTQGSGQPRQLAAEGREPQERNAAPPTS